MPALRTPESVDRAVWAARCSGRVRNSRGVKSLAFAIGLCITAVGAVGIVAPSTLVWIGERFATSGEWYALGAVRIAFGLLLLAVAKASRAPRTLRVVACIPLLAGVGALATPLVGLERARAAIAWWSQLGSGGARFAAIPLLALGGFVAYACDPFRRTA